MPAVNHLTLWLIAATLPPTEALFSNSTFWDWGDFSNNFATDLSPLLSLFGEYPTKQFLSESTSGLDSILFGIGPLGIVTTVVSVIRLYGNARWKSIIGRSQEPRGVAESELCSSTSADVCELWSHGGISRVFGRPKILAFIFTGEKAEFYRKDMETKHGPAFCGIDTPANSLSGHGEEPGDGEKGKFRDDRWQEVSPQTSRSTSLLNFAPNPNLTLNIGIRQIPPWLRIATVLFCLLLQGGFLGIAFWATYDHSQFYDSGEGQSPASWAFVLTILGTGLLSIGMGLCAWLVDAKSRERRFTRKEGNGRVFWLQPGGQRAGDQLFNAFAYHLHEEDSEQVEYVTSWRVEDEHVVLKEKSKLRSKASLLAVSCTMLGWFMQFIGLRGVPDVIAIFLFAITLFMAAVRAFIRSTRLEKDKNDLRKWENVIEGHELDWQALSLVRHNLPGPSQSDDSKDFWRVSDEVRGEDFGTLCDSISGTDARDWILEKEKGTDERPHAAAQAMRFRARLAYLTSEPQVASGQAWSTEARIMASRLQTALETSADYIFSHFPLQKNWQDVSELTWSATCEMTYGGQQHICFYMSKDEQGSWSIDVHQLEAALGLWSWSTKETPKFRKSIVVIETQVDDLVAAINLWVTGSPDQLRLEEAASSAPTLLSVTVTTSANKTLLGQASPTPQTSPMPPTLTPATSQTLTRPPSSIPLQTLFTPRASATPQALSTSQASSTADALPTTAPSNTSKTPLPPRPPASPVPQTSSATQASPPLRRLGLRTRDSLLQLMAQDLFTIFMSRIATVIDPLQEVAQREPTSRDLLGARTGQYLGLTNPHLEIVVDALVDAGVASRKEALMSFVPMLALKKRLPDINNVAEALLTRAKKLRREDQLRTSEKLLNDLFYLGPAPMRNRVLRQLGEIYRSEMFSGEKPSVSSAELSGQLVPPHTVPKSESLLKFDSQIKTMRQKLRVFKLAHGSSTASEAEAEAMIAAEETVQCFEFMFDSLHTNDEDHQVPSSPSSSILDSLCISPMSHAAKRAKALTLKSVFASELTRCEDDDLLKILKFALDNDIPELVEDMWSVKQSLINREVNPEFKDTGRHIGRWDPREGNVPSPLWCAIESKCEPDTLESFVEWPGIHIEKADDFGRTALFKAAMEKNKHAVRMLLQKGAVWKEPNSREETDFSIPGYPYAAQSIKRLKPVARNIPISQ